MTGITKEALNYLLADEDSDLSSLSSDSDSSQSEFEEEDLQPLAKIRCRTRGGGIQRRGIRARGGKRPNEIIDKDSEQSCLEEKWSEDDLLPIVPSFTGNFGQQIETESENPSAVDFFHLFFTDEAYQLLVEQTNLYAHQYIEQNPNLGPHSLAKRWVDVTVEDMKLFIALTLLTGVIKKPAIHDYWSTDKILKTPVFNDVMPRNRYQSIQQFLHFADNSCYDVTDPSRDRLYKVRPIVDVLVNRFKTVYIPTQHVSIDEELLLFKGRLAFKQYIPNKRVRFGIKIFSLCEDSGYLWNSFVYLGKTKVADVGEKEIEKRLGKSGAVVVKLMHDLFNQGYKLYIDNWYTSENLLRYLMENGTSACGTVRINRAKLPKPFSSLKLAKRGILIPSRRKLARSSFP